MSSTVRRLGSRVLDKIWGSPLTEPWFLNPERRQVGEIWFETSNEVPLLVKLLFTSDKLSVQVHPDDVYAREHENSPGKTEMWHVLRAEPGAQVAIGLREEITREQLGAASSTPAILGLLNWIPVSVGGSFFIPAGTIHAIGAGLVICEIQQISDATYRLYDYDRRRELHVEKAMDVSHLKPLDGRCVPASGVLAECRYFRTSRFDIQGSATLPARPKNSVCVAVFGEGIIAGETFGPGEAFEIPAQSGQVDVVSREATFVITSVP